MKTFLFQYDNDKLKVKVITVIFLDAVATVYVLTGSNNDIKIFETQPVLFVHDYIKSPSCFERINKLDHDFLYRQILSLLCPLKYHVTLPLSHHS